MKEEERLVVVKRVDDDVNGDEIMNGKLEELTLLEKDEKVLKYLQLKKEVNDIKNKQKIFMNDKRKMIEWEFDWAFHRRINSSDFSDCQHSIWIYEGSYLEDYGDRFSKEDEYCCYDENDKDFSYNKYVCLECDKTVRIKDYKSFEEKNLVLKNRDDNNIELYRWIYYQELYNSTVEEAQAYVISEFYKNMAKGYTKKRVR